MSGVFQFYKSKRNKTFNYTKRAKVDRFLITKLDNVFKSSLYTNDEELAFNSNINLL
jgi:hypothetical protein